MSTSENGLDSVAPDPGPRGIRLFAVFVFKVVIIAACLAGVTSFLFVSLSRHIDENIVGLVEQSLRWYEIRLRGSHSFVERACDALAVELQWRNLSLSSLDDSVSPSAAQIDAWTALRLSLLGRPFVEHVYESAATEQGGFAATTNGRNWSEQGCSISSCYRFLPNATVVQANLSQSVHGYNASLFPSYFNIIPDKYVPASPAYLEWISAHANDANSSLAGQWTPPTVWNGFDANHSERVPAVVLTYARCLRFNHTLGSCVDAVSVDVAIARLLQDALVFEFGAAGEGLSVRALFHLQSMRLLASSFASNDVLLGDMESHGISFSASALHRATETPYPLINSVLSTVLEGCSSTMPFSMSNSSLSSYDIAQQCNTSVRIINNRWAVGLRRVPLSDSFAFLLLTVDPLSKFYGDVHRALSASIAIISVACAIVVITVGLTFVLLSRAVENLIANFQHAAALNYEAVTSDTTASVLTEINELEEAFRLLSDRLLQTRAFLPHQILVKIEVESPTTRDSETSSVSANPFEAVAKTGHRREDGGSNDEDGDDIADPLDVSSEDPSLRRSDDRRQGHGSAGSDQEGVQVTRLHDKKKAARIGFWPRPQRLNLSASLASRRVTVLFANKLGFHSEFTVRSPLDVQQDHATLVEHVVTAARGSKGVVDFFHGDHFMVSFNASSNCAGQGGRAALAAVSIIRGESAMRIGISTGNAFCGVFGGDQLRRFSIVGTVVNQAFALMHYTAVEQLTNLVSSTAADLMKDDFVVEHRGAVTFAVSASETARPTMISTIRRRRERSVRSGSHDSDVRPGDGGAGVPRKEQDYDKLNAAFEAAERGEINAAKTLLLGLPVELTTRLRARIEVLERADHTQIPQCL